MQPPARLFSVLLFTFSLAGCTNGSQQAPVDQADSDLQVFEEVDGFLEVEAEDYHATETHGIPRNWMHITSASVAANNTTDHTSTASNGAYLEALPDTRVTHDDSLIVGTNFFPEAGVGPMISYTVRFNTPGTYTLWARAYSTGTEDNGIHAGINDTWPESSQRLQWCEGKNKWTWTSAQRVPDNHCGTPGTITMEIAEAGLHTIQFSMREDGVAFDKWIMTTDTSLVPVD